MSIETSNTPDSVIFVQEVKNKVSRKLNWYHGQKYLGQWYVEIDYGSYAKVFQETLPKQKTEHRTEKKIGKLANLIEFMDLWIICKIFVSNTIAGSHVDLKNFIYMWLENIALS